jgi:hypothetical protein
MGSWWDLLEKEILDNYDGKNLTGLELIIDIIMQFHGLFYLGEKNEFGFWRKF